MFVSPVNAAGRNDLSLLLPTSNPLIALAGQRALAAPNYLPTKVNATLAKVNAVFAQPVVWKNDLVAISAAFTRLSPPERQSLVNLMARPSARGELPLLTRWLSRVTHLGMAAFDGLDEKGRLDLWKQLVVGQDKANLARIFQAANQPSCPSIKKREYHQMQFAQAIAAGGSVQQRIDFASALHPGAVAGAKDPETNRSGRAIAVVMAASTDPTQITAFVKTLGREGMDAVVQASLPTRDAGNILSFQPMDTGLFRRLASAMALSGNAREKASFVSSTGLMVELLNNTAIGQNRNRKQLGEVSRAISAVIGTDTTGVIENVMLQSTSENRSSGAAALKAYARAALDSGIGTDLGAITLQLQRGNDLKTDPMAYLGKPESRSGEQPTYARARVMGGWLGLVSSAVQTRINRRDTNAAYSSLLFTGSVDVLKEVVGGRFPPLKIAVSLAAPALKTAINFGLLNWRNEATKTDRSFAQGLIEGALPRHRNGVESTAEWTQTMKIEQSRRLLG